MITRVEVHGYKSLAHVDVALGPLAVVVGPNNVGKSNFFDLLRLVAGFAEGPLERAFTGHRGDPVEAFNDPALLLISVKLTLDLKHPPRPDAPSGKGPRAPLDYELSVRFDAVRGLFEVVGERLDWVAETPSQRKFPFIGTDGDHTRLRVTREGGGGHPRFFPLGANRTVLSQIDDGELYPTIFAVQQYLRSWRFYQFEPQALRQPSPQLQLLSLASDGTGLSGVLDTLRREHPPQFTSIQRELMAAIPEVRGLDVVDTGDLRRLLQIALPGDRGFTGRVVSDGVLRFLAVLVLAYSPRPGGLVCFEEPENGVHPGRLAFMAQHLRGIARERVGMPRCQVLVNSHSPYLVDHLAPSELVLAMMGQGGDTRLLSVEEGLFSQKPDLRAWLESGDLSLGELWFGGHLDG